MARAPLVHCLLLVPVPPLNHTATFIYGASPAGALFPFVIGTASQPHTAKYIWRDARLTLFDYVSNTASGAPRRELYEARASIDTLLAFVTDPTRAVYGASLD